MNIYGIYKSDKNKSTNKIFDEISWQKKEDIYSTDGDTISNMPKSKGEIIREDLGFRKINISRFRISVHFRRTSEVEQESTTVKLISKVYKFEQNR